ncbi:MAG: N-acetyl-gamma-glutamyl-phosphate reductase [Chloroflexi bacterium]|nr:N-acetyl-gamma-glutamyl-phosphate reductase [Chloroflexota bacterium]
MIKAAIVGASGYAGGELLRLLLFHPQVQVTQITSQSQAGQYAYFVHPNLRGCTNLRFVPVESLEPCDVLFLAMPHAASAGRMEEFAGVAQRVVDLSADFRLRDPAAYPRWYGWDHPTPDWLSRFVYGLPELHRQEMAEARYISGVGCNASCTILALAPLMRRGLVERVVVDVKVGSSEGGNKATAASHHAERANVVRSYAPVGHRHAAEIIQELGLAPENPGLYFSVTSVDMVRGALATCHCFMREPLDERGVWEIYRQAYGQEPFVRLVRARRGLYRYPDPKILAGSNFCDIGFAADEGSDRLVVVAAIDNLMKGSAGSAVQAMNLMHGLPETMGLEFPGLHPV